ncbi:hypothetical protein [Sphingopyxis sp. MWB1]|uniref:hypothetical protein n=1 Tax=Sphingopyxis sp. MWB1 TaxID=1537715 RepID=UPI00051A34E3|nr:hypothetical protein [Sphingopyxis sp. MWB1]
MIDNFSIALTHGLMAIALWRMLHRDDLDHEVSPRLQWQQRRDAERAAEARAGVTGAKAGARQEGAEDA